MALVGSNSFFLRIDYPLELFNSLSINLDKSNHSIHTYFTVPIDRILSVKNARAWVSMVSYLKNKLKLKY